MEAITPTGEKFQLLRQTESGKYVLGTHAATGREVYVLTRDATGTIYGPRWECTKAHYDAHIDIYRNRFPVEHDSIIMETD